MSVDQGQTLALKMVRRVLHQGTPPGPVHHFVLTRVGNEILLEAGYLDLVELKQAIDTGITGEGEPGSVTLTIHHQMLLTPDVLEQLSHAVEQIVSGLNKPTAER